MGEGPPTHHHSRNDDGERPRKCVSSKPFWGKKWGKRGRGKKVHLSGIPRGKGEQMSDPMKHPSRREKEAETTNKQKNGGEGIEKRSEEKKNLGKFE